MYSGSGPGTMPRHALDSPHPPPPSQADDGTIAASRYDDIVRMTQNGTVLNRIDPPALTNSVSHPVDGPPVDVATPPTERGSPTPSWATSERALRGARSVKLAISGGGAKATVTLKR